MYKYANYDHLKDLENKNIEGFLKLGKPAYFTNRLPITKKIKDFVINTRKEIEDIIQKRSNKLLFVIGPCSIHNTKEALEYGKKLKYLADKVSDKILIVMRVYFEKPRTTVGWKGLINDPYLNETYSVNKGLYEARKLLLDLNNIGIPCGYEVLDPITPQYIADLVSWGAIGARTTESQVHRQLVSGLSMPVGFKNGTGGSIKIARDAILSAQYPHCFMGITRYGEAAICRTKGNNNCHLILRGGSKGPNYMKEYLDESEELLKELPQAIMVDCSHGNSLKNHKNQEGVLKYIINEIKENRTSIIGVMIESNINEGKQVLEVGKKLLYGVSITDSCLSIEETVIIVWDAFLELKKN